MTSGGRLLSKSATFSTRTAAKSELLQRKFPRCIIYPEPIHGLFWELYPQVSREARQPGGESGEANVISNWEAPPELRSQSVDSVVRLVIMFGMGCGMVLFLVLCKIVTANAVSIRLSRGLRLREIYGLVKTRLHPGNWQLSSCLVECSTHPQISPLQAQGNGDRKEPTVNLMPVVVILRMALKVSPASQRTHPDQSSGVAAG